MSGTFSLPQKFKWHQVEKSRRIFPQTTFHLHSKGVKAKQDAPEAPHFEDRSPT